jgi:hypothetical protein
MQGLLPSSIVTLGFQPVAVIPGFGEINNDQLFSSKLWYKILSSAEFA